MPHINYLNTIQIGTTDFKLTLANFPFDLISEMINETNYESSCLQYAQFYYSSLENMEDRKFGWLSPLLVCIIHSDSDLLATILRRHGFPLAYAEDKSPIVLCKRLGQISCLKAICLHLLRNNLVEKVKFCKEDFRILLRTNLPHCHAVVSGILKPNKQVKLQIISSFQSDLTMQSETSLLRFMVAIQKENHEHKTRFIRKLSKKALSNKSDHSRSLRQKTIIEEKQILNLPFAFDFSMGSLDSIEFMRYYKASGCDDFVQSDWKVLVESKWRRVRWFRYVISALYFFFIFLTASLVVFDYNDAALADILIGVIGFFFLMEVFELVSCVAYDWRLYVLNPSNWLDWLIFLVALLYPIITVSTIEVKNEKDNTFNDLLNVLGVVILILIFYRSLAYLRIFDYFRSIIEIIKSVICRGAKG